MKERFSPGLVFANLVVIIVSACIGAALSEKLLGQSTTTDARQVGYSFNAAHFTLTPQNQPGRMLVSLSNVLTIPTFIDGETPAAGNSTGSYTLAASPNPATSLHLYLNGLRQSPSVDFTLAGNVITFCAACAPTTGDIIVADYRK